MQGRGPVVPLYDPAVHAVHAPPFGPVCPGLHRQFVETLLPPGDCEFGGQTLHVSAAEAPIVVEYVLAPQPSQVVSAEAPSVEEYVPAPQSTQAPCVVAPVFTRYLPAPQSTHAEAPGILLYFPSAHTEHSTPSAPM